jgi:hypothetical protein
MPKTDPSKNLRQRIERILQSSNRHTGSVAASISSDAAQALVDVDLVVSDFSKMKKLLEEIKNWDVEQYLLIPHELRKQIQDFINK